MKYPEFVQVKDFDSAELFLEYIRLSNRVWGDRWRAPWIFRGHADADWELRARSRRADGMALLRPILESICRKGNRTIDEFDAIRSDPKKLCDDEPSRQFVQSTQETAERIALREFVELADDLGLRIEDSVEAFSIGSYGPTYASAMAQHHGIPTPMIDWTRNPLVAAFFAAVEHCSAPHIAVWALNTELACRPANMPGSGMLHTFECPRSSHAYLHAQDGLFTWTKPHHEHNYMLAHGIWPDLLQAIQSSPNPPTDPCLHKLTLARVEVPELRRLLWRERVSRAHLMPTFDNVSNALQWKWKQVGPFI